MLKIAHDYMKLMGIENTQFIIARHIDRDHPHCHIVFNRVDNDGRTISDKNDRFRNEKVCKMLTARYRLHFSEGKENIKFHRLRKHDKVKHFIYLALRQEVPNATSWSELRRALRRYKIDTEFKLNRRTGDAEGVKFKCEGFTFSGSKIDRQFSFVNIASRLEENAFDVGIWPRHNCTPFQQREEPRQEIVRQEPSEECSLCSGLLDLATAPVTDPEEDMLAKQYVKKKKKPQRKRGFRL
ncbi:MAG: relaxase/mobilization nuclease domain-containing protein [Muribaculaceae bacterium]|nr:relaxase/mobilization nuclease domain-containing protein [Muribaculaceae bacterium]